MYKTVQTNMQHSAYCLPGAEQADTSLTSSTGRSVVSNVEVQITIDSTEKYAVGENLLLNKFTDKLTFTEQEMFLLVRHPCKSCFFFN
jgi:hypothetical protein